MNYEYKTLSFLTNRGKAKFLGLASTDAKLPNIDELSAQIDTACNDLNASGYEVINIMPILIGETEAKGAHVAFSVTRGATITGRRPLGGTSPAHATDSVF